MMESCVPPNSRYLHLSQTQDCVGWDCFVEARIPTLLLDTIQPFLHQWSPRKSLIKWGISFLKTLMNLTHKQWIFRNADVHHKIDELTSAQHDALSEKIRTLMKTSPADLFPCHRHLLDRNFHNLGNGETIHQQLWTTSMESAISAAYNVSTGHFTRGSLQIFNKHASTTHTRHSAHHSQHCSARHRPPPPRQPCQQTLPASFWAPTCPQPILLSPSASHSTDCTGMHYCLHWKQK